MLAILKTRLKSRSYFSISFWEKKLNEFQIFNFNTSSYLNDTIKINSQETGSSTGNIIVQLPVFRKTRKIKYYFNR